MNSPINHFTIPKLTLLAALSTALIETAGAQLTIIPEGGFNVTWDGNDGDFYDNVNIPAPSPAHAGMAGTAFAADDPGGHPVPHQVTDLNDGFYGNSSSHINGNGGLFMGIGFRSEIHLVTVAWGRDNGTPGGPGPTPPADCCGGQLMGRWIGTYLLQITTVADPDASTPDVDWTTIGTFVYTGPEDQEVGGGFTPWLRHQYAVSTGAGDPIAATGVRIVVSDHAIAIDELELYVEGDVPVPPVLTLAPVQEGGEIDAANNLAAGGTAFAKDVVAGRTIGSLNDQTFGDASAWVGNTADSFAGVSLGAAAVNVSSFAFGRDNTGAETDRSHGTYLVQVTDVANPDENTPDEDWNSIGEFVYEVGDPTNPHLRHRFNFTSVSVTGLRVLTPDGAAIDELEIYEDIYIPPPPPALSITPAAGFTVTWDGNDGDFYDNVSIPAPSPAHAGMAGTAFAADDPGGHPVPHVVSNLNDGFYGNSSSHINGKGGLFMGIGFRSEIHLVAVAWGRDNGTPGGAIPADCCGGQLMGRWIGTYTLQFTTVANPDANTPDNDWTTVAVFDYTGEEDQEVGGGFTPWLRHQYAVSTGAGDPIAATGVRIVVSDHGIAIDELELYGAEAPPQGPRLEVSYDNASGDVTLNWPSQDGKLYNVRSEADPSSGLPIDWPIFGGFQDLAATPPENSVSFPLPADPLRLFVVEEFPAPPESVFADNFESGQGQWTTGEDDLNGNTVWEHGTPSNVGPTGAKSGTNCFGTNLAGNYAFDANAWLRSPEIPLTNAAGATLCYERFIDIEPPGAFEFDWGTVSVLDASDDSEIAVIEADITDFTADWEKVTSPIPAAALGKTIKLEFRLQSDDFDQDGPFAGFYIDDVNVTVP